MNKTDAKVLFEVSELMLKCPSISPNPYEIAGTVMACHDFQKINRLVSVIISSYTEYSLFKHKLNDTNFDGEYYVLNAKEKYEQKLEELREFIKTRESQAWK